MRFRYFLLFFQLVLFFHPGFGQKKSSTSWGSDSNTNPKKADLAGFQINDIKNRGLIIRLKTDKNRIAAYRKAGNDKIANDIEDRNKGINLLLMYSFITQWSYCPIYFMESDHTLKLLQEDTLIAKTYDLQRDTSIYMNRDSFYILDYGEMMEGDIDGNHPLHATDESSNPVSGKYLVVKDHSSQLHAPMPFHSKIAREGFPTNNKMQPLNLSKQLEDSVSFYVSKYPSIATLNRSEAKPIVLKYLDSLFDHIYFNLDNKKPTDSTYGVLLSSGFTTVILPGVADLKSTTPALNSYNSMGETGMTMQKGTRRLNKLFIDYYCMRLDKDRNIISRIDLPYWWQRNPNIPYLLHLKQLEKELKDYLDKSPKYTKPH